MAPKSNKKTAKPPHTPTKGRKQKSRRKAQLSPEIPSSDKEVLSYDEDPEPSLRDVMFVLGDISARLPLNEENVDNLTSHRCRDWLTNLSPVPPEVQTEYGSPPLQPKMARMLSTG